MNARAQSKLMRRIKALRTQEGRARVQGRARRWLNRLPKPLAKVEMVQLSAKNVVLVSGFALGMKRPDRGEAIIAGVKTSIEVGKARPDLLRTYPEYDEAYGGFSGEFRLPAHAKAEPISITLYKDGAVLHTLEAVLPQKSS